MTESMVRGHLLGDQSAPGSVADRPISDGPRPLGGDSPPSTHGPRSRLRRDCDSVLAGRRPPCWWAWSSGSPGCCGSAREPTGFFDHGRYLRLRRRIAQRRRLRRAAHRGSRRRTTRRATRCSSAPSPVPRQHAARATSCRSLAGLRPGRPRRAHGGLARLSSARRLAGPVAGIVAAFVYALYPNLVFHTGVLLCETLYIFLFLAFLAVLLWRPWPDGLSGRRVPARPCCSAWRSWCARSRWPIVPVLLLVLVVRPAGASVLALDRVHGWPSSWSLIRALDRPQRRSAWTPSSRSPPTPATTSASALARGTGGVRSRRRPATREGVQFGTGSELRNDRIKTSRSFRFIRDDLGREPWLVARRRLLHVRAR